MCVGLALFRRWVLLRRGAADVLRCVLCEALRLFANDIQSGLSVVTEQEVDGVSGNVKRDRRLVWNDVGAREQCERVL